MGTTMQTAFENAKAKKPAPAPVPAPKAPSTTADDAKAKKYADEVRTGGANTAPTAATLEKAQQEKTDRQQAAAAEKASTPNLGKVQGYAKGGYVRAADGIAQRGKTRGKWC